jgi:hypothetical protein
MLLPSGVDCQEGCSFCKQKKPKKLFIYCCRWLGSAEGPAPSATKWEVFLLLFLFTKRRRFLQPLTLAALHARVLLVNHVHATTATNDAAVLVADFGSLQAVTDLHVE